MLQVTSVNSLAWCHPAPCTCEPRPPICRTATPARPRCCVKCFYLTEHLARHATKVRQPPKSSPGRPGAAPGSAAARLRLALAGASVPGAVGSSERPPKPVGQGRLPHHTLQKFRSSDGPPVRTLRPGRPPLGCDLRWPAHPCPEQSAAQSACQSRSAKAGCHTTQFRFSVSVSVYYTRTLISLAPPRACCAVHHRSGNAESEVRGLRSFYPRKLRFRTDSVESLLGRREMRLDQNAARAGKVYAPRRAAAAT